MKTISTPKLQNNEQIATLETAVKTANETTNQLQLKVQEQQAQIDKIASAPAASEMDLTEKTLRAQMINGIINIAALTAILGREPNYPNQKVGNVTMRKLYGRDEYKQIS
jgi:hypothetical protein